VTVERLALGRAVGRAALFGGAGSGLTRMAAPNPEDGGAQQIGTVTVQTVDDYCAAHGLVPDWMLIDVEGFEFDVLAGAAETIRRCGPGLSIVVEIHPTLWEATSWTRASVDALLQSLRRKLVPLTGQEDSLGQYGSVLVEPLDEPRPRGAAEQR
jgi:hypothetical protein